MVAAWIRADTGVGPSMASGSQTCRGNWALLPMVPQKMHRVAAVSRPPVMAPEAMPAWTPSNVRDLVAAQSSSTPRSRHATAPSIRADRIALPSAPEGSHRTTSPKPPYAETGRTTAPPASSSR